MAGRLVRVGPANVRRARAECPSQHSVSRARFHSRDNQWNSFSRNVDEGFLPDSVDATYCSGLACTHELKPILRSFFELANHPVSFIEQNIPYIIRCMSPFPVGTLMVTCNNVLLV